jgi:hypothetical protein
MRIHSRRGYFILAPDPFFRVLSIAAQGLINLYPRTPWEEKRGFIIVKKSWSPLEHWDYDQMRALGAFEDEEEKPYLLLLYRKPARKDREPNPHYSSSDRASLRFAYSDITGAWFGETMMNNDEAHVSGAEVERAVATFFTHPYPVMRVTDAAIEFAKHIFTRS